MTDRDRDVGTPQGTPDKVTMMNPIASSSPPALDLPRLSDQKLEKVPKFLKPAYRPKPNTSLCLNKDIPVVQGLCFKNMAEAQRSMALAQWHAPRDDDTIPKTEEEYRNIAKMLVDAFKDMRIAKDTATNAYRRRFTPGESVYYQDWAIEACAWDIISKVMSIHTEGFKVPIYDKSIVDYIGQTQLWLFQDRIDWICQVARSSKHVAVTLMKHEKNWTTIGAPHKLYSSTLVNCISNAHRGKWVKDGREADKNHQERPMKGKRTKDQLAISNGDGVGMDHAINMDPGAAAGGEETEMPQRELIRKRQKVEHIASDGEDVDMDDAINVDSDAGVHSLKKSEKSPKPSKSVINSPRPDTEIIALFYGELPTKSVTVVQGQDTGKDSAQADETVSKDADRSKSPHKDSVGEGEYNKDTSVKKKMKKHHNIKIGINYHPDADIKGGFEFDNGSELSEAPDGLLSDTSYASPINKKMDDLKGSLSTLEPRTHDAVHLDGARMLASLHTGR